MTKILTPLRQVSDAALLAAIYRVEMKLDTTKIHSKAERDLLVRLDRLEREAERRGLEVVIVQTA